MDSLIESYRERCRAESLEENILQLDLLNSYKIISAKFFDNFLLFISFLHLSISFSKNSNIPTVYKLP